MAHRNYRRKYKHRSYIHPGWVGKPTHDDRKIARKKLRQRDRYLIDTDQYDEIFGDSKLICDSWWW